MDTQSAKAGKADHFSGGFIIQSQFQGFQALKDSEGGDGLQFRQCILALPQAIVRDSRIEMMNVMKPDVAREPAKDGRKPVIRTALRCGPDQVPVCIAGPVNILELVLDVKEPQTATGGYE